MLKRIAATLAAGLAMATATASHALTIVATFNSSISNGPNAAAVEASINNAIQFYSQFTNPITVRIDFQAMSDGLGGSVTGLGRASYSAYTGALATNAALNPQNALLATALDNLKYGNVQPTILGASANLRALGFSGAAANPGITNSDGRFDGVVSLNTSIMNFTDTPNINYAANSVIQHEVDEVLGMGGPGSLPDQPLGPGYMGVQDLYRYSAPHTASFTSDPNVSAYFSIDGGNTDIRDYNSVPDADLGDWNTDTSCRGTPFVQDAFLCPGGKQFGLTVNSPEVIGLQAIGYDLAGVAVPEPDAWASAIIGLGLAGSALRRRRVGPADRGYA